MEGRNNGMMARSGWKWLELLGRAGNGWNSWKHLKTDGNAWNGGTWLEMAGIDELT